MDLGLLIRRSKVRILHESRIRPTRKGKSSVLEFDLVNLFQVHRLFGLP